MRVDHRKIRREKKTAVLTAAVILCVVFAFVIKGMLGESEPDILLKVKSGSILQDEEIPPVEVLAECKNSRKLKKELEKGYTVKQFVKDLNSGKGYKLQYQIDNAKEGSYPVKIVLDKKLETKIGKTWKRKVKVGVEDGTFEVRNKYGTWDGEKFKRPDGSYVTSDFIVSKGEEYYFDEDGKMVTGERVILNEKCVFGKDGKLISKERFVDPDRPMIAITLDDGPGKYTEALLQKLEEYHARATFFMLGHNAERYPEAIKKMEEMGCDLGNHSWSHTSLLTLDDAGVKSEIDMTNAAISAAAGHGASLVRPPYGKYDDRVKSLIGLPLVMWSVDTLDWKRKDAAQITEYVLNTVSDGDIVLMHDIHDFSVEALMNLIPELTNRGFQLVTVSEMAKARGIPLEAGNRYSVFQKQ